MTDNITLTIPEYLERQMLRLFMPQTNNLRELTDTLDTDCHTDLQHHTVHRKHMRTL